MASADAIASIVRVPAMAGKTPPPASPYGSGRWVKKSTPSAGAPRHTTYPRTSASADTATSAQTATTAGAARAGPGGAAQPSPGVRQHRRADRLPLRRPERQHPLALRIGHRAEHLARDRDDRGQHHDRQDHTGDEVVLAPRRPCEQPADDR